MTQYFTLPKFTSKLSSITASSNLEHSLHLSVRSLMEQLRRLQSLVMNGSSKPAQTGTCILVRWQRRRRSLRKEKKLRKEARKLQALKESAPGVFITEAQSKSSFKVNICRRGRKRRKVNVRWHIGQRRERFQRCRQHYLINSLFFFITTDYISDWSHCHFPEELNNVSKLCTNLPR